MYVIAGQTSNGFTLLREPIQNFFYFTSNAGHFSYYTIKSFIVKPHAVYKQGICHRYLIMS